MSKIHYLIFLVLLVTACGGTKKPKAINSHQKSTPVVLKPAFNADSAYHFVDEQVAFGPRVPGTDAHKLCAQYFEDKLSNYGAQVTVQAFSAKGFDGHIWEGKNVIASFQASAQDRIMLCAHWDSRFIAEADKDSTKQKQAIDGANDGASGVGVLLEIARQLQIKAPNVGVDIIFFDVEDQGAPSHLANAGTEHSWCLGSQHWANEAASMNYNARWGILLDMVGAPDAVFYKDQISMHYAGELVDYVWNKAASLGYTDYFINQRGGGLTDDHLYVNQIAGIPCIDIIDYDNHRGFNSTWHTHDDNMGNIDKNTLYMVGDVVLEIIYEQ